MIDWICYDIAPTHPGPPPLKSCVHEYLYNKTQCPVNSNLKQKIIINWGVCINCQLICHRIKKKLNILQKFSSSE